jgi:hypothetical protein
MVIVVNEKRQTLDDFHASRREAANDVFRAEHSGEINPQHPKPAEPEPTSLL